MIKKLLAVFLALFAAMAFAAVDANKATPAELDGIKGIGPAIAGKIVDERNKAPFKNWQDMIDRVKGVGENNAAKFSEAGLTVNGTTFNGMAAKMPAAPSKTDAKMAPAATPAMSPAAKADTKAAPATAAAKPAEMSAADKKAAAAQEKADKKAAAAKEKADKAAAKKAAAEEAKKAKTDKAAAAKAAKEAKAGAAAPAASAAAKSK